jgi:lipid A 3-O-deacylase
LGRQVQNSVHNLFGFHSVRGWNFQLGNEFGFTASWERKWRFNHELGEWYSWEIIPDAGVTAGNVFTYAEAGFLVRLGRGLKADWGPEMIRPGYSGSSYFSGERAGVKFGWDFYVGAQARAVSRSLTAIAISIRGDPSGIRGASGWFMGLLPGGRVLRIR